MHVKTNNQQARTSRHRRIATMALAGAAAGLMFLPAGQGVAGASAGAAGLQTGVGYVSGEKPTLGCGHRGCGRNWWGRHWCGGWCHGGHHHRHHHHEFDHHHHEFNRHHHDDHEDRRVAPAPEREEPVEPPPPVKDKPEKQDKWHIDDSKWPSFDELPSFGDWAEEEQ
ncbi:hypothetical protein [Nonomuraea sp. NPDC049709]|uniref:hypothetical protein n=1 Tax=Nonomuraea sp. NPDC049709 TaxID=3154736 RepID=UPI0034133AE2